MKTKYWSILVFVIVILTFSVVAIAFTPPANDKAKEPLDKITFIHYKDGTVKAGGKAATDNTCYKLLGVKWKTLPVSYVINPKGYEATFVANAISASTLEWDSHTLASLFGGYTISNSATWDDTSSQVDYQNEYVFGAYPDSSVIAVTNVWYTRFSRQIVDYDVLFNTQYFTFKDCSASGSCPASMDLQNIATHETGHGIGLADIYSTGCTEVTMYGYSGNGETKKRTLAQPDITGLQKMYG